MENNSLKRLLLENEKNPLVRRCLDRLSKETVKTSVSLNPVLTSKLLSIYSLRVRMDLSREDQDRVIDGGDDLLRSLGKEISKYITVSSVDAGEEVFVIFANCDLTRLIGIVVVHPGKKTYVDLIE
jgi:hypothetical protein